MPEQDTAVPIRLPILIGISGQRRFSPDDPQQELRLRDEVSRRLSHVFAELDRRYPNSPKLVISGGAAGADLLAVQAALQRPEHWHVAILLPFARDLFEEDFDEAQGFSADLDILKVLLDTPQGRVTVKTLPLLQDDCGPDKAWERLSRKSAVRDRTFRHMHYEQVGQWIAEAASIFIAVTSAPEKAVEEPNGGTVRVMKVRREGRPDKAGLSVARQSLVLQRDWPLLSNPSGSMVWHINPLKPAPGNALGLDVLHPLGHLEDHHAAPSGGAALAKAFDQYNVTSAGRSVQFTFPALPNDPCAALAQLRTSMSEPAGRAKGTSIFSFRAVAFAFLAAVIFYELFAKVWPEAVYLLAGYIVCLLIIWGVVLVAWWRRWQSRAEDYRAVSELLRIQRAWWAAGLPDRVDREHLQGADRDLSVVRDAVTSILSWVWLKSGWPDSRPVQPDGAPYRDWNAINTKQKSRDSWIPGQKNYFGKNHTARERLVVSLDSLSWLLFVAGGLVAVLVLAWKLSPDVKHLFVSQGERLVAVMQTSSVLPSVWAVLVLTWLQDFLVVSSLFWRVVRTILLAFMMACCFALLGWCVGLLTETGKCVQDMAKKITILAGVLLPALAGALRYFAEKMGYEAEALQYREAHGWFVRASEAMEDLENTAAEDGGAPGSPSDQERQAIVLRLGRLALKENEAWLKTRRERPLTPVSG